MYKCDVCGYKFKYLVTKESPKYIWNPDCEQGYEPDIEYTTVLACPYCKGETYSSIEKIVYYAHPINIYGSIQEERDLITLNKMFKGYGIYNPSEDSNADEGYEKEGMEYFLKIVDQCKALAFRSFIDGKIPKGVMSEINRAKENGIEIIELPNYYNRALNVEDTRQYLIDIGYR